MSRIRFQIEQLADGLVTMKFDLRQVNCSQLSSLNNPGAKQSVQRAI